MNYETMIQEVINIVQDETFTDAIPGYINEAFLQASGRVNVPDLKRIAVASTVVGSMYTTLSGISNGFGGRLTGIVSEDIQRFRDIESLVSWADRQNRLITEVGPVEVVALEGRTLWYFPTPATSTPLTVVLFTNPKIMEDADEVPDAFPEICHRNIGIHGAAFQCFQIIEDGIDGAKVNTAYHYEMFEKGITQLVEWIGRHKVHSITSTLNDDAACTQSFATTARWNYVR